MRNIFKRASQNVQPIEDINGDDSQDVYASHLDLDAEDIDFSERPDYTDGELAAFDSDF